MKKNYEVMNSTCTLKEIGSTELEVTCLSSKLSKKGRYNPNKQGSKERVKRFLLAQLTDTCVCTARFHQIEEHQQEIEEEKKELEKLEEKESPKRTNYKPLSSKLWEELRVIQRKVGFKSLIDISKREEYMEAQKEEEGEQIKINTLRKDEVLVKKKIVSEFDLDMDQLAERLQNLCLSEDNEINSIDP